MKRLLESINTSDVGEPNDEISALTPKQRCRTIRQQDVHQSLRIKANSTRPCTRTSCRVFAPRLPRYSFLNRALLAQPQRTLLRSSRPDPAFGSRSPNRQDSPAPAALCGDGPPAISRPAGLAGSRGRSGRGAPKGGDPGGVAGRQKNDGVALGIQKLIIHTTILVSNHHHHGEIGFLHRFNETFGLDSMSNLGM